MKELNISEEFDVSVGDLFLLLFHDKSTFMKEFHESRSDTDFSITAWLPHATSPGKFTRTLRFFSVTSNNSVIKKIAGSNVQMQEDQIYQFESDKELIFETSTEAVSMKDSFGTTSKWIITALSEHKCILKINVCAEYKGSWFKGTIENFIHEQSVSAYQWYIKMAKEKVSEFISHRSGNASFGDAPKGKEEIDEEEEGTSPEIKKKERRVRYEDDAESTGDDEFFDAMDTQSSPSSGAIQQITKELDRLRSIIESTHTRLMGLEAAFANMQDRYIPVTNKSQSVKEKLNTYLQRLDITSANIDKQKREDQEILKKLEEVDKRLQKMNKGMTWLKGISVAAFVVLWPFVATAAFKMVRSFLASAAKK